MGFRLRQHFSALPLLQILEWILLVAAAIVAALVQMVYGTPALLGLNLIGVAIFASLGWIAPQRRSEQILYTAIELALVVVLVFGGKFPLFQLLLIALVLRNCQICTGLLRTSVTVLAFLVAVFFQTYRLFVDRSIPIKLYSEQIVPLWLGLVSLYGLTFLFLHLLVQAIATEHQSRAELAVAHDRLRHYAEKIEELATIQERNRIAREIHDSLGHTLTIFNFHLQAAIRLLTSQPSKAAELLQEVKQLGDNALQEVSRSVSSLRTSPLDKQSLPEAIALLVHQFHQTTGVMPLWEIDTQPNLPDRYRTTIYRIVQESLTNMCKYAAMTQAQIQISQTDQAIKIAIQDNGRGFDLHKNTTGFGLQGMQERVTLLSGKLEIITAPDRGCQIVAVLPLA